MLANLLHEITQTSNERSLRGTSAAAPPGVGPGGLGTIAPAGAAGGLAPRGLHA